jgi:tungstate transport system ATP-binding protein
MNASILPLRVAGLDFAAGGETLLRGLDFELHAGPRTIILGPNGAGKSLTLRLCHGLLEPSAGSVTWAASAALARRRQAMVFDRPLLLRRSVLRNVTYGLAVNGVGRAEREERARQALAGTGLMDLAHRSARVLSAGEQKRLALARAWALRPEVLFLDEPTANLDPAATRVVEEIADAIHRSGTKIVMTTHDLGEARRLADEILFLHRGRLLEHAPAEQFFEGPESPEARAFIKGDLLW